MVVLQIKTNNILLQGRASFREDAGKHLANSKPKTAINLMVKHSAAGRKVIMNRVCQDTAKEIRTYVSQDEKTNSLKKPFNRDTLASYDIDKMLKEFREKVPHLLSVLCSSLLTFEEFKE